MSATTGEGAHERTRRRYLALLRSALTDVVYETTYDATSGAFVAPSSTAQGNVFPPRAVTMVGWRRLDNVRAALEDVVRRGVPGDFMETGVWRGGACIYAKAVLDSLSGQRRRVIVADSFRGLPPPDVTRHPADAGDAHHTNTYLAVSEAEVRANFRRFDVLDDAVVFHAGFFAQSFAPGKRMPFERLAVLRLDGDMYGSTMDVLNAAYDAVSPGGYVIVDDYALAGARRAVDDFRASRRIASPLHAVDWTGVYWIKDA